MNCWLSFRSVHQLTTGKQYWGEYQPLPEAGESDGRDSPVAGRFDATPFNSVAWSLRSFSARTAIPARLHPTRVEAQRSVVKTSIRDAVQAAMTQIELVRIFQ